MRPTGMLVVCKDPEGKEFLPEQVLGMSINTFARDWSQFEIGSVVISRVFAMPSMVDVTKAAAYEAYNRWDKGAEQELLPRFIRENMP